MGIRKKRKPTRPRGDCRHCPAAGVPMYARGLCARCYFNPAIRYRYDGPRSAVRRDWTTAEVERLRKLRAGGLPVSLCAVHLRRTTSQVQNAIHRLGLRSYERDFNDKVARYLTLYDGKRSDLVIASVMGCSRETVRRVRNKLGLPRSKNNTGRRGLLMECFACPKRINPYQGVKQGWMTRPLPGRSQSRGKSERECYCPSCFQKWGWPPVITPAGREA